MKNLFTLCLLASTSLFATVRNVPATYPSIQGALSACSMGDTVLVQPGNYMGNLNWPNTAGIKLFAAGDSSNTSISANTGRIILINSVLTDTNTIIRGFTIRNGFLSSGYGAGISITGGGLKLQAVVIRDNHLANLGTSAYGAGIHMNNSVVVMENSTVRNNQIDTATWCYGGGIYKSAGNLQIRNSKIKSNVSKSDSWCYGTGIYVSSGAIRMTNTVISGNKTGDNPTWNYGAGAYLDDCQGSLINILVEGNSFGVGGSFNNGVGIYVDGSTGNVNLTHVTFTNNFKTAMVSASGLGLYVRSATATLSNSISFNANPGTEITVSSGTLTVSYSDVEGGYTGTGNININPQFVSATNQHLQISSPCAGTGTPAGSPNFDLDNASRPQPIATNPDMGCYEVSQLVGTHTYYFNKDFKVYPNPTTDVLNFKTYFNGKDGTVKIYAVDGRLLKTEEMTVFKENQVNVSDLNPGIYFLELRVGKNLSRSRFVINQP